MSFEPFLSSITIITNVAEENILYSLPRCLAIFGVIPHLHLQYSPLGDILDADRETIPFFLEMGMHCLGCPASRGESVEEACAVHGVDADELVKKINDFLASKSSK